MGKWKLASSIFDFWNLELGTLSLELGAWKLELGSWKLEVEF